jgi:hypothetical protein
MLIVDCWSRRDRAIGDCFIFHILGEDHATEHAQSFSVRSNFPHSGQNCTSFQLSTGIEDLNEKVIPGFSFCEVQPPEIGELNAGA